jgi:hypothetical protein
MEREVKKRVLRNSALYGILVAILLWLLLFNELTVGDFRGFLPYLPDQLASTSLSVVLLPLLVSFSVFYVASLFSAIFEGTFNEVLVGSLYATGFAAFFALALIYSPGPGMLNSAGYLFLAAFAVLLIYNSIAILSRVWKRHALKAVAASATIYIEGQIAVRLLALFTGSSGASMSAVLTVALSELLDLGLTIAAAVSLLAILKTSRKPPLSAVGAVASNYRLVLSACVAGSLYFNYFRGRLMPISPGIANLSPYIEWTAICIVAALVFARTHRGIRASMMTEARLGDWMKHVQEVSTYKGDRFVGFTEIVDDFLERGRRERLLISLTMFLNENRVGAEEISLLLSDLINYEDAKKPVFSITGRAYALERENEARRRSVLQRIMSRILPMGFAGSTGEDARRRGMSQTTVAPVPGLEGGAPGTESSMLEVEGSGRDEG